MNDTPMKENNNGMLIGGGLALVLVVALGYFVFNQQSQTEGQAQESAQTK